MKVGDRVTDKEGRNGVIDKIYDIHNVNVKYDNDGGWGLYCLDRDCEGYDPLVDRLTLKLLPRA